MTYQQSTSSQNEKPVEGYRGTLVYQQEYGYKFITIIIDLRTPDEQSMVRTRAYDLDITEEADHIPSTYPPLAAIDVYDFPAVDGTEIMLTVKSQTGERRARYTIHPDGVEEHSSFLWLSITRSSESVRDIKAQPLDELSFTISDR
jgi:hypothetical protein